LQTAQAEGNESVTRYLFTEVRKLREELQKEKELREKNENRLSKVEEFIGKVGQAFSGFFRRKGVNISGENQGINEETTEGSYLDQRPEMDMDTYKAQLEAQGLSPQEIVQRMSRFENAAPFEGGVNIAPENQGIAPEEEIPWEEYTQGYRPSFNDYAKGKIKEGGGVTPSVASEVATTRQRIQDAEARMERKEIEPSGLQRTVAETEQKINQAFRQKGVNIAPENQIYPVEKTAGQLYDEAEARGESGLPYINLAEAGKQDDLQQAQTQQQPEVVSTAI
jgi:hypothetical protein